MSSFLQKARDRAQEAAAQFSGSHGSHGGPNADNASPASPSHISGTTYTGSLPHVFRQGLANLDPRFESTRSLHVMRGALKGIVIDEAALSRETKSAAAKTFKWGLDHRADERMDGVGDAVLVDVTDRLAYVLSTLGDLEQEHSQRLSAARANLKQIQTAELELAQKRAQRVKIAKELHDLTAHRVKAQGAEKDRATQQSAYLHQLTTDAQEEEEHLSKLKRQALRECFEAQFDSYIQHGEKLSLVASYGKLLSQQIPIDQAAPFPAHKGNTTSAWEGSHKTAQIRAMVGPAFQAYQPRSPLPQLPSEPIVPATADTGTDTATLSSFGTSHAHELAQDEARTNAPDPDTVAAGTAGFSHAQVPTAPLSPLPETEALAHNPNLNHSPSTLPAIVHRVPPPPPPASHATDPTNAAADDSALVTEDAAPPGPTVAETGAILPSSPDGPGPKSGVLQPRRRSSAANQQPPPPPVIPPRPLHSSASSGSSPSGPVGNSAPAVLPPGSTVNARVRRDGTITRRGQDHDYEKAEEEQLPPYVE